MSISYKKSGVNYSLLDPVKKMAQIAGLKTSKNLVGTGFSELNSIRGESAYVLETKDCYFALVSEGLGTKNLVADEMGKLTGKSYYEVIAVDTVAMIVNDLVTVGAKPLTVSAYWAVGDTNWWSDKRRVSDLISGWKKGCDLANCSWGGGETPTLKGIIHKDTIDLAGAGFGIVEPKKKLVMGDNLKAGDAIIFLESSGIHANGLSLARKLAEKLPLGYKTLLSNRKMYGEELLIPTIIYSKLSKDLFDFGGNVHYIVNITGHGWRKLMRAKKSFTYVINTPPETPEIFKFIKHQGKLSDKEMYATFNMGAGYAIFVKNTDADRVVDIARKHKIRAWISGQVEKGPKRVYLKSKNIVYEESDLKIR